ncbi:MAG: hypothetical protein H0U57_03905 [Tatlockia sp.]|nr:hypothetical protein [Tatlockia sp.]
MSVCKLGLFSPKKNRKNQNLQTNLNLIGSNLKTITLRRILCAFIQNKLQGLISDNLSTQAKKKQKRALIRFKFNLRKRNAKKQIISQSKAKKAPVPRPIKRNYFTV